MRQYYIKKIRYLLVPLGLIATTVWAEPTFWLGKLEQDAFVRSKFGMGGYQALTPDFIPHEIKEFESMGLALDDDAAEADRVIGVLGYRNQDHGFSVPIYRREVQQEGYRLIPTETDQPLNAWGLKWRHWVDGNNSFAVAARRGRNTYNNPELPQTTSTMTSFSWSSQLDGDGASGLTGSIYLGDEMAGGGSAQELDRKYYGIILGGRMAVFEKHTSYLSFQLQKSDIQDDFALYSNDVLSEGYYSQISAGWDWKVMRNWNVRAEANYTLNGDELDFRSYNRNRIFFGTRYDFR